MIVLQSDIHAYLAEFEGIPIAIVTFRAAIPRSAPSCSSR